MGKRWRILRVEDEVLMVFEGQYWPEVVGNELIRKVLVELGQYIADGLRMSQCGM